MDSLTPAELGSGSARLVTSYDVMSWSQLIVRAANEGPKALSCAASEPRRSKALVGQPRRCLDRLVAEAG